MHRFSRIRHLQCLPVCMTSAMRPASSLPNSPPTRDVTLTVFMEGTSNPMQQITTQIALFSRICNAEELKKDLAQQPAEIRQPGHYKLAFDGCGVSHGLTGVLFANGLREQCGVVRSYVEAAVGAGFSVVLNFVGLSRGGIGGLYLAQELAKFPKEKLLLNLLLFDPVPGNFIWMSRFLDWGGVMNANQAMDISDVKNLGRIVSLYPHEPLPAIAVHAPLLARYPESCTLEVDVILGCHQGALFLRPKPDTCLAFARIRDFLLECGSLLDRSKVTSLDVPDDALLNLLDKELTYNEPTTRDAHAWDTGMHVIRRPSGQFLCRFHQELARRVGKAADIDENSSVPAYMLDMAFD
eukprot:TRINITY_DN34696_c0_g1_i1.p1 TRINITY_DN34696_c0_g1~~TRINITY_DN34696_c0_g1_i1.p1  ORF type:complete len:353 (+),score=63.74 TRINITY_DN34696_c0_g1_i1:29-1087(+)